MIGRHQMRGWRKLKSGLMRITGSAHIYYPIREIDSCRRRTRHSNFGEGGGPDHYLSFVLPVVQWLNALNWDPVGGQGLPLRLSFWFWLSSSASSLELEVSSKTIDMDLHSPLFIHLEVLHIGSGITSWRRRGLRRRRQGGVIICGSDFSTGDINR